MVFTINMKMHVDSYLGFTLSCLLENLNVRLCVFHQLITTKDRHTE